MKALYAIVPAGTPKQSAMKAKNGTTAGQRGTRRGAFRGTSRGASRGASPGTVPGARVVFVIVIVN
ncbi:hypothetical protein GCM10009801_56820 [Streptomyces albiaxialis]|uniref:Uncharacterized protein n=1 Tax=Streptomyces albiaxialis TaxID=329523 RepID=A0ABN2WHC8_9ACTN